MKKRPDYLWHRPNTSIIWFSMAVPKELQASVGRKVIQRSLGTSHRRDALRLADKLRAELEDEWRGAIAQPSPDTNTARLALEQHRRIIDRLEETRRSVGADETAQDQVIEAFARQRKTLARRRIDGNVGAWEDMADRMIANRGLPIERGSEDYRELVDALAEASIEALSVFERVHDGEIDVEPKSPTLRAAAQQERDTAAHGESLLDLFDRYADQRRDEGRKRADTLTQDRKVIEQFAEFVGVSRSIASITPADVRDYRDTLRSLPPKWRERRDMRGLNMRDAAVKARAAGMPQTAHNTINKHLSTISPLYAWLIKERWDVTNPCTGLFYEKTKGKNPRPPFGTESLNRVLASPLFVGFQGDGKEHLPGNMSADDWRFWIPMLCLFSGMRVGEAAQLKIDDVNHLETADAWVIDIRHAPDRNQTTKSGQSRITVAHRKLIDLGFTDFVARQKDRAETDGDTRLFPDLEANERDQIGATPSEFWRDYLVRIGLKTARDGLGAHSFRHELADRLREEAGLVDDQIAVALGHDQKSTTAGYGTVRQGTVRFLKPVFDQVAFEGVSFDHLAPERRNTGV